MEWIVLLFDGNPRALLHDVARVGCAKLGRAGGWVHAQAGSRGGPSRR